MRNLAILVFFLGLMAGCGPAVQVTGEWTNPDVMPAKDYEKVMINAMISDQAVKRAIENALATQLQQANMSYTKGYELFPTMFSDQFEGNKDEMIKKIRGAENDAILSVNLLDKDTKTRYVPGTVGPYRPLAYGYNNNFWGNYNYWYPTVYDPGYYTTTEVYYIEANLYDAESEKLIWSAQTQTYDPAELDQFASELAETIVDELQDNGLLTKNTTTAIK